MRILVVHPGHLFSTADVYDGLCYGISKADGVKLYQYPLHHELELLGAMAGALNAQRRSEGSDDLSINIHGYATSGIVGISVARQFDWVLVVTGSNVPNAIIATLRRAGIKTALLCTESPYLTRTRERIDAAHYDVVFTMERNAVSLFDNNPAGTVHYLPHAYHPERHTVEGAAHPSDVCFIGTRYPERAALFDAVNWDGINFVERSVSTERRGDLAAILNSVTDNRETAAHYRGAKIVLNHHRTSADLASGTHIAQHAAQSLGPRAYEIAACGAFQLCDDSRDEYYDVFGADAPTYRSGDATDLERQLRHYLANDSERERWASAMRDAVAPHSWINRAAQLLTILSVSRQREAAGKVLVTTA